MCLGVRVADAGGADETAEVIAGDGSAPREEEEVVASEFRECSRCAGEFEGDHALLVEVDGAGDLAEGRRDSRLGNEVDDDAFEDLEALGVGHVDHRGAEVGAGKDVRDGRCGSVGLSVLDEVDVG